MITKFEQFLNDDSILEFHSNTKATNLAELAKIMSRPYEEQLEHFTPKQKEEFLKQIEEMLRQKLKKSPKSVEDEFEKSTNITIKYIGGESFDLNPPDLQYPKED